MADWLAVNLPVTAQKYLQRQLAKLHARRRIAGTRGNGATSRAASLGVWVMPA